MAKAHLACLWQGELKIHSKADFKSKLQNI
jgi:hypothetical protein